METSVELQEIAGPSVWDATLPLEQALLVLDPDTCRRLGEAPSATASDGSAHASALAEVADQVAERLRGGPGFVVIRRLPTEDWSAEEMKQVFWGIGRELGSPLSQRRGGVDLYPVADETPAGYQGGRQSRTSDGLVFHTDSPSAPREETPEVFALLTIRKAVQGGVSKLISAHRLYNELLADDPEIVQRLTEPVWWHRGLDDKSLPQAIAAPVFETGADTLRMRYRRPYIERGYQTMRATMDDRTVDALDALDRLLTEERSFSVLLEDGDVLFADNGLVLHSRTQFTDDEDPDRRRLLYRLWLRAADAA